MNAPLPAGWIIFLFVLSSPAAAPPTGHQPCPSHHPARPQEARPQHARGQGPLRHERRQARPACPRVLPPARGGPGGMAPAHPRPEGRLPAGRRLRGEAGHRHRRRDVEGDPRRPLRGRGAHRHPAAPPRPLARRRPPGARARGLAHHVHPLFDRRRHRHPPRPARLPRASQGEADRPDPDGAPEHGRTRARKRHERIIPVSSRPRQHRKKARTNSPTPWPAWTGRSPVTQPTVRRRRYLCTAERRPSSAQPKNSRSMPTIRPSAQAAVPGQLGEDQEAQHDRGGGAEQRPAPAAAPGAAGRRRSP